jgi:uracil-DNA glycosylase
VHALYQSTHPQWHPILKNALSHMEQSYLTMLQQTNDWLPGLSKLFAAFNQPLTNTRYILLGESPYPRVQSANGYAFWDANVKNIWQPSGLSKAVNRATSLRNFIKMLLVARGDLTHTVSQDAIAKLDKSNYCTTIDQLFANILHKGILLLNASLVYRINEIRFHAKQWQPFMISLINQLTIIKPLPKMILFGQIAAKIPKNPLFPSLIAEHPYNVSFITNQDVLAFFKPFDLLGYHHD